VRTLLYMPKPLSEVELLEEVAPAFSASQKRQTPHDIDRPQEEYYVVMPEDQPVTTAQAPPSELSLRKQALSGPQLSAKTKTLGPGVYARTYDVVADNPGRFVIPPARVRARTGALGRSAVDVVLVE